MVLCVLCVIYYVHGNRVEAAEFTLSTATNEYRYHNKFKGSENPMNLKLACSTVTIPSTDVTLTRHSARDENTYFYILPNTTINIIGLSNTIYFILCFFFYSYTCLRTRCNLKPQIRSVRP